MTLLPGVYIFDDIDMKSDSTVTITGPTTIYLDDDFDMQAGAVFNTTQNPADLTIIVDGDDDGSIIKRAGNAEF